MAVVYGIANGTQAAGASNTFAVTIGTGTGVLQAPAIGDLIYLVIGTSSSVTVTGVTDSQGQTYALAKASASAQGCTCYALINAATLVSGVDTITVTFSATTGGKDVIVKGCTGVQSATADAAVSASGTSAAPSSGATPTLAQADELVIGGITNGTGGGTPTGFSFGSATALTVGGGTISSLSEFDEIVASTAAQTASATIVSAAWGAICVSFKLAPPAAGGAAPAAPGRTWLRRFHHPQRPPQFPVVAVAAAPVGNQPGGLIARRSSRQYSRAVTGSSGSPAGGSAGPPLAPSVVAVAAPRQLLPVAARRYPPRAVFRGVAAAPQQPLLLPRPPPSAVASRPLAQRPRALARGVTGIAFPNGNRPGGLIARRVPARAYVRFTPVATTNAVPPRGAQPGGLVRRRGPARAVVAFRPVTTVNAHGPAGALPGTGLVRGRPAGQIHRVVWAGTTVRTTNNVAVPRGTVPPRPAVARRAPARALIAFTPVRTVNSTRPTVTGGLVKRRSPARALIGFTPAATVNASGPAGAAQPRPTVGVPRRAAARGLWQRAAGPANAHGGGGAQPGTGLVRRRSAARAFIAFRPVRTVNNTVIPPGTVPPKPVVARRAAARAVIAFRPVRTVNAAPAAPAPVTGGVTARRHPKQVSRARTGLGIGGAGIDAAARLPQPATGTGLVRRRAPARALVAFRPVRTINAVPPRGSAQPKPVIGRRYPARAYVAFRPVRTTAPLFTVGTLTAQTAAAAPAAATTTTGARLTAGTAAAAATATDSAASTAAYAATYGAVYGPAGGAVTASDTKTGGPA